MIAAIYVATAGPYFGIADVDPWDEVRDARQYAGPWSIVAHPPCERWGRYATGGPNPRATRRAVGDDGGCFEHALAAVRVFGGVLEHPEASKAWDHFGLARPPRDGGWVRADAWGFTCCIEQGNYGHPARKATWLYSVRTVRPELRWGASTGIRIDEGFNSKEEAKRERERRRALGIPAIKRLTFAERIHSPAPFRDLLIDLARSVL